MSGSIVPPSNMTTVFPRHQYTSGWRTYGASNICLRKPHSLPSHFVQGRCFDKVAIIAAKISIPLIIRHDENDIGLFFGCLGLNGFGTISAK